MKKELVIRSQDKRPLNPIAYQLVSKYSDLSSAFIDVSFETGASKFIGSGDEPILEIRIIYDATNTQMLERVQSIIEIADIDANEIEIIYNSSGPENTTNGTS